MSFFNAMNDDCEGRYRMTNVNRRNVYVEKEVEEDPKEFENKLNELKNLYSKTSKGRR